VGECRAIDGKDLLWDKSSLFFFFFFFIFSVECLILPDYYQ
jgi:hypothetical protein